MVDPGSWSGFNNCKSNCRWLIVDRLFIWKHNTCQTHLPSRNLRLPVTKNQKILPFWWYLAPDRLPTSYFILYYQDYNRIMEFYHPIPPQIATIIVPFWFGIPNSKKKSNKITVMPSTCHWLAIPKKVPKPGRLEPNDAPINPLKEVIPASSFLGTPINPHNRPYGDGIV